MWRRMDHYAPRYQCIYVGMRESRTPTVRLLLVDRWTKKAEIR